MKINFENSLDKIRDYYDFEEWEEITDFVETLEFKLNKSEYHLENIRQKISLSTNFEVEDYYEKTINSLYFEVESFIIGTRSTVDIIMHVLNKTLSLELSKSEVNISAIYKHKNLTTIIKNVLHRYTHNRDSIVWNFIYRYRNEVVHEKSISQLINLNIDIFSPKPLVYFNLNGEMKNLVSFFESCIVFLQRFITHLFEAISVSLDVNK